MTLAQPCKVLGACIFEMHEVRKLTVHEVLIIFAKLTRRINYYLQRAHRMNCVNSFIIIPATFAWMGTCKPFGTQILGYFLCDALHHSMYIIMLCESLQ